MKKFIELIRRIHQERFSVVMNKIVAEKIPVTFLSVAPLEQAVDIVKNLRKQNLNVTNLITSQAPPLDIQVDFNIINLSDCQKIHPRPEYIFSTDDLSSRIAYKYLPKIKTISLFLGGENSDNVYNAFFNNLEKFFEVYVSLIDEESRKTFYGYWLGKASGQFSEFYFAKGAHYTATGFIPEPNSIFIDGGVCEGSTSKMFAELGCKVYGFEMDRENFELAKKVAKGKNFVVENFGLGSYNHKMKYTHAPYGNIGASRLDNNGSEIAQIITLDSYVREKKLPRVDCIKLDVEGAELDVLKGASTTIKRWKPILLLSAYHKLDDFYVLMNYVKSIRSDYEWALRHFTMSNEDDNRVLSDDATQDFLYSMGLDIVSKNSGECCLLAR